MFSVLKDQGVYTSSPGASGPQSPPPTASPHTHPPPMELLGAVTRSPSPAVGSLPGMSLYLSLGRTVSNERDPSTTHSLVSTCQGLGVMAPPARISAPRAPFSFTLRGQARGPSPPSSRNLGTPPSSLCPRIPASPLLLQHLGVPARSHLSSMSLLSLSACPLGVPDQGNRSLIWLLLQAIRD